MMELQRKEVKMNSWLNKTLVEGRMAAEGIPSISELARRAEVPQSVMSRAMSHTRPLNLGTALRLKEALGVTLDELVTDKR